MDIERLQVAQLMKEIRQRSMMTRAGVVASLMFFPQSLAQHRMTSLDYMGSGPNSGRQ